MSLADSATQRARFIAKIARIQLELTDLAHEIDAAMRGRPMPGVAKLLAAVDVHIENASAELGEAAKNIGAIS